MRVSIFCCLLGLACLPSPLRAQGDPVKWVNEYIGTANEGQTFPATGPPFAMTQWTPQTRQGTEKCIAPYYFADTRIRGFRGSHFLSGSCTQDYGSMTLMPLSGAAGAISPQRSSSFTRASESATPYRYAVHLNDENIDAEVTGTVRSGLMRFRYHRPGKAWLLVECNGTDAEGSVQIDPATNEVVVVNLVHRLYAGNGKPAGFSGYFVVQFDHPFHLGGTFAGRTNHPGAGTQAGGTEGPPSAYISFDTKPGEAVQARIGSSFTSLAEARRNLAAELPTWDFDTVANAAKAEWNQSLGRIQIQAADTQKRIFYTALYHSMLLPRVFSDVSGTYPAFASGSSPSAGPIQTARGYTYYCDYSLWDTFRALHPLLTILDPARELDMVKSLIAKGEEGGFLPIYPAWNSYTSEMIGDHADAVIMDAWAKGIRGFDLAAAYRLMRKNATELPTDRALYIDGRGRRALDSYLKYGYVPLEDPVPFAFHKEEQVSRTLEYAYDDFLVGEAAQALGNTADADLFHARAQNFRNVIDPAVGFARGRHADGSWITPFNPLAKASYVTEALPIQYTFFVPQDIPGLIQQAGGPSAFVQKLDTLFSTHSYDQGNEPSHHIAYLYDNAGQAWKSQLHLRDIMDSQYTDGPSGLSGNDDCGQMSAWYIFSALGFYPVTPGTPMYQFGTPLFDQSTLNLPSGSQLRIQARGAAAGKRYIQSVTLNGVPLHRFWITHSELLTGGDLVFQMSSDPAPDWPGKS